VTVLNACSAFPDADRVSQKNAQGFEQTSQQNVHHYVKQLTKQLFFTAQPIDLNRSVAVGTFLPTQSIDGNKLPMTHVFGQQVQESFITLATQAGLNVIEFKTANVITLKPNQDIMLSRQVSEINPYIKAEYYLTGTYTAQQENIAINARLIETSSQRVVAAATDFIPKDVMWAQGKVMMNGSSIYRTSY
jgi:TolB-like protein